jgi:hypothetical protein
MGNAAGGLIVWGGTTRVLAMAFKSCLWDGSIAELAGRICAVMMEPGTCTMQESKASRLSARPEHAPAKQSLPKRMIATNSENDMYRIEDLMILNIPYK